MSFKKLSVSNHYTWWFWNILLDTWYTVPTWKVFIVSNASAYSYNGGNSNNSFGQQECYLVNQQDIKKWINIKSDKDNIFSVKWFIFTSWERIAFRFYTWYTVNNIVFCWTVCWEEIPDA